jgi:hypothetical protein
VSSAALSAAHGSGGSSGSAALSAAHGSSGSSGSAAPHSPKHGVKTHNKGAAAAAAAKKRITFDLPEDAEEEEREVAEEAAAHDEQLAGKAVAAAKGQLAVPGSGGVLTPTNTLAEGSTDVPVQATTDVLAAAAGKLTHGSAAAGAGPGGKASITNSLSQHDADVRRGEDDQGEAVAWATVVEKQGVAHGGEAQAGARSQASDAASPFQAEQPDDFSPFQVRLGLLSGAEMVSQSSQLRELCSHV